MIKQAVSVQYWKWQTGPQLWNPRNPVKYHSEVCCVENWLCGSEWLKAARPCRLPASNIVVWVSVNLEGHNHLNVSLSQRNFREGSQWNCRKVSIQNCPRDRALYCHMTQWFWWEVHTSTICYWKYIQIFPETELQKRISCFLTQNYEADQTDEAPATCLP